MNSKEAMVNFGGKPIKQPGADFYQSTYALTKILNADQKRITKDIKFA